MSDWEAIKKQLESIAISLKRIADSLENKELPEMTMKECIKWMEENSGITDAMRGIKE